MEYGVSKNKSYLKNSDNWFWGIAFLSIFIEFCWHVFLPISISNDSYGYIALSQNLGQPAVAWERSVGYPILLHFLGINRLDTFVPVILIQALLSISLPLIIFKSLLKINLRIAIMSGLISCFFSYNFLISLYILTEPLYVFSVGIYAYFLIRYFTNKTLINLLMVILTCWFIGLVRVSGSLYFFAFLVGLILCVFDSWRKNHYFELKVGLKHCLMAVCVFSCFSFVQHLSTNRTSSVVWPHFVFNWVYKSNPESQIQYGIIQPANGPKAQKLFQKIKEVISSNPGAFDTLKMGGTPSIQKLTVEPNGMYSNESVELLMNDLIYNNKHDLRSWWIEGILINKFGILASSELLGNAIKEAFITHPETIFSRLHLILRDRIFGQIKQGISVNIVTLPTAYFHQIPSGSDVSPGAVGPGLFKQWTYSLFQHTGHTPENRTIDYPYTYPNNFTELLYNVQSDNLIGFGHYLALKEIQIMRLCWILIGLGILILPFVEISPVFISLLIASILPPVSSVFLSETDPRHLLMSSPLHLITAGFVLYILVSMFNEIKVKVRERIYA